MSIILSARTYNCKVSVHFIMAIPLALSGNVNMKVNVNVIKVNVIKVNADVIKVYVKMSSLWQFHLASFELWVLLNQLHDHLVAK